jgi:hypothetical protein
MPGPIRNSTSEPNGAPTIVRTTGFLVRDEPDVVSIAQEILPEEDGFRAVTHIPRGMIEDLMCLRGGDDRSASPGTLTSRS